MSAWVAWLLGGLGLLIAEMVLAGAFLMWIGLAACGAGLLTLVGGLRFELQAIVFAVLAAISLAVGLHMRRRQRRATLNTQQAGLVGRAATALGFRGREGRVRVGDSDWAARLPPEAAEPALGARLRVVDVEGTVLIVRPEA